MSLRFSDLVPSDPDDAAKRARNAKRPSAGSGPLSIYGFDLDPDEDPHAAADAEADAPPDPSPPDGSHTPKRSDSTSIYGFDVDPDALSGAFVDPDDDTADLPDAPFPADVDPDQLAGRLVDVASGEAPTDDPEPPSAPRPAKRPASDRPAGELLAEVAAALAEPAADPDEGADDGPAFDLPEGSWLDTPAGGPVPPARAPMASKPTETVSPDDLRRRPRAQPPAPATPAPTPPTPAAKNSEAEWGSSTQAIAEELLKAVDEEQRGLGAASSEDDLAALLSAAISPEAPELPRRGAPEASAVDPATIPADDFRAVAAGLIAELEASLSDIGSSPAEEHA